MAVLLRRKPQAPVVSGNVEVRIPRNHSGQDIMERHMARFNVAQCGRRFGKTTFGKRRALRIVLQGKRYGWFAPTYKLLADAWRDLNKRLTPIIRDKSEQEKRIETISGGILEMWTLDSPDGGRGKDYHEVGVDEAGLVKELKERWEQDIRPTLTITRGPAWFYGTPKGRRYFHKLYELGQEHMLTGVGDFASFRMPSILNPAVTAEEIRDAKRDLPADVFNQEYMGIPADDGGNPFGLLAIAACSYSLYEALGSETFRIAPKHREKRRYVAGVDLARAEDYTVVYIMDADTGDCVFLDRFRLPWETTVPRIAAAINEYRAPFVVDATGVGDKVARDVMKVCRPQGQLFVFTGKSKQDLMERLMTCLHRKEVRYPKGWLVSELENFGYEYTKHGVRYEAAQGMHDDGVISLGLAVYARDHMLHLTGTQDSDAYDTVKR